MAKAKKTATISILGPIGSFTIVDEVTGQPTTYNGLKSVDVISQVTKLDPEVNDLVVEVGGLGGSIAVAKSIRRFLKSIQGRYTMTGKKVDDLASAHTIIFSALPQRLVPEPGAINPNTGLPFANMVHNPWITHTSGDADKLAEESAEMRVSEEEFVGMYVEDGMDEVAIRPLMKDSAEFNDQQALDLGFATGTYPAEALNQAAYKTPSTMATQKDKKKQPAKANPILQALATALGLKLETSGEGLAAAPPADLVGKAVIINGQPAVDGVFTVVGGVVTVVAPVPAAGQEAEPAAAGTAPAPGAAGAPAAFTQEQLNLAVAAALGKGKKKKADPDPDEEEEEEEDDEKPGKDGLTKRDTALIAGIAAAFQQATTTQKGQQRTSHVPVGFKPENKVADAKEWDRSFAANEHTAMKRDDYPRWERLFYAKYGKMPVPK